MDGSKYSSSYTTGKEKKKTSLIYIDIYMYVLVYDQWQFIKRKLYIE